VHRARPRSAAALASLALLSVAAVACVSGSIALPSSQCDEPLVYCPASNGCSDTQTDPRNCGMCGKTCNVPAGEVCSKGMCGKACSGGASRCGAACVDLQVDRQNCGACGKACLADEACSMGTCALSSQAGLTACPKPAPPVIDAGTADAGDAGDAGAPDAAGDAGDAGGGFDGGAVSDKVCVDTKLDARHCGGCGMACPANKPTCKAGVCQ
jgi:hypothetical protein